MHELRYANPIDLFGGNWDIGNHKVKVSDISDRDASEYQISSTLILLAESMDNEEARKVFNHIFKDYKEAVQNRMQAKSFFEWLKECRGQGKESEYVKMISTMYGLNAKFLSKELKKL